MQAKHGLLMSILDSDKPHGGACDGLADGFRIRCIILIAFDVWLHELRGHELDGMPHGLKLAGPVVGTATGFHPNQAGLQIRKIGSHLFSFQFLFLDDFAVMVYGMDLKKFFSEVNTDRANFHNLVAPIR